MNTLPSIMSSKPVRLERAFLAEHLVMMSRDRPVTGHEASGGPSDGGGEPVVGKPDGPDQNTLIYLR